MAGIISSGIGSGLDIAGIVQQLVIAEGQPVEARISQKEARAQAKLSAFGSLKSALSDFRDKLDTMKDVQSFLSRQASSANEDVFVASAGTQAVPASYAVEVVALAQAQRLTSGAFADSATAVGTGTLLIGVGAESTAIEIGTENNTLAGIRDAINNAVDNPGVVATIVNADSGSYLILTSEKPGSAQTITVTQTGGDGGLSALEYDPGQGLTSLVESVAAQDAHIRIDGLDVMSTSNKVEGAIDGITIDLLQDSAGSTVALHVSNDQAAARQVVNGFVESYNALIDTLDATTDYNAESETAAPLLGDATVRGIRDQIRRELSQAVKDPAVPFATLREIGLEVQLDGKLQVNEDEISTALGEEFVNFGQLFAAPDGYAVRLHGLVDGFLKSGGIIDNRTEGLTSTIDRLADDREDLNERLLSLETRLLRQFNALDSLLAQLSSTSNFLAQQLNNLPGYTQPGANG